MSTTLIESPLPRIADAAEFSEGPLQGEIWGLLAAMYPQVDRDERRREERFPYPRLVHLTPVAADGFTPIAEPVVVAGKHLSGRGLGFYHPAPLPHRLVVASLEQAPNESLHVLLDVSWCRFRRGGWYESGGRFLRRVPWRNVHHADQ
jgi:hypothetical protein